MNSEITETLFTKEKIENALKSLNGNRETQKLKRLFASFFKDTTYDVYTKLNTEESDKNLITESAEWLFDLTVVKEEKCEENGRQSYLTDTILALESEMCCVYNHVMYDFQKLLVTNSHYKVILFRDHSTELNSYFDYMKRNIEKYRGSNGTFFLIGFSNNEYCYTVVEVQAASL